MTRDQQVRSAVAQPLTPSQEPAQPVSTATLHDWSARQRLSAVDALRYSRFVAVMKRALPILAVVLMGSVIAYSVIPHHQEKMVTLKQTGNVGNDLTMTKPSFTGTDEKGNPYHVTAAEVVQDPKSKDSLRAEMKQVDADMQFDGQTWINASAAHGFIDAKAGILKLDGGISLFTDNGYEMHTPSATAYIKTNVLEGNDKVSGHGPLGKFSADRFRFDRLNKKMRLNGHVHMILIPQKAKRR
jgi:lipopolysaccharide export system protein LptC